MTSGAPDAWDGMAAAADALAASSYAVALTGAGLSVESGIPSFRGPDGLWTRYGQPSNLSYREFVADPQGWWEQRLHDEVSRRATLPTTSRMRWTMPTQTPDIWRWRNWSRRAC